jgi:hypothetical protein
MAYAVVPQRHEFTPRDEFYYLYHVPSPGSLEFLSGRRIYYLAPEVPEQDHPTARVWRPNQIEDMPYAHMADLRDGDLIVIAPEHLYEISRPLPPATNTLVICIWKNGAARKLVKLPA